MQMMLATSKAAMPASQRTLLDLRESLFIDTLV